VVIHLGALALLLGLVLTQAAQGHAFSIGLRAASELVAVTPIPTFPFYQIEFSETLSCIPGHACGSGTTRYAVLGTAQATIPAEFQYDYRSGTNSSSFYIEFTATDLNGALLARLRAAQFSDSSGLEVASCASPGSCVAATAPLEIQFPRDPQFTYVPISEFPLVNNGAGVLPLSLPVGPGAGIGASIGPLTAGISFNPEFCIDAPEQCHVTTSAVFTLVASPPPGASFLEPVPEPTTLLLVGTTAAGLGVARWRQRRRNQHP
jgi:hypothetical protein